MSGFSEYYSSCSQCSRKCGVNRSSGVRGFCTQNEDLKIASAGLHFGEEPLITVFGGSGTIFFTGCTLRCSFCQNYQISQKNMGRKVDSAEFTKICLDLQEKGAENINLVTGSHHIPKIAEFLTDAKAAGLKIPVAWNSSAYESVEMLELLKGLVDIWLPDLKTLNPVMSKELFGAEDYPSVAKKAIRWMINNFPMEIAEVIGVPKTAEGEALKTGIDSCGGGKSEVREKMLRGVIIRHLFLPGRMGDTELTLEWLKLHADGKACISLMNQYTPVPFEEDADLLEQRKCHLSSFQNRLVNIEEDKKLQSLIENYGFEYLFYQELSDDDSWLPDFNRRQPFSNALATPVWHWTD